MNAMHDVFPLTQSSSAFPTPSFAACPANDHQNGQYPERAALGELGLDKMRRPDPLLAGMTSRVTEDDAIPTC